jgi:hypothetical protein
VNPDPAAGLSVNVTEAVLGKFAVHVPGQLIPAGLLVTVPLPDPVTETVSVLPEPDWFRYAVSMAKSEHMFAQLLRLNVSDVMFAPVWSLTPMYVASPAALLVTVNVPSRVLELKASIWAVN